MKLTLPLFKIAAGTFVTLYTGKKSYQVVHKMPEGKNVYLQKGVVGLLHKDPVTCHPTFNIYPETHEVTLHFASEQDLLDWLYNREMEREAK